MGWFDAWLSEGLRLIGEIEKARDIATQAIAIGREVNNQYVSAWAQRVLGRIALTSGALSEAESRLTASRDGLAAIESRFELGQTYLALAELARATGDRANTVAHLEAAQGLFTMLRVPRYISRTEQFARESEACLSEGTPR